ncbi:hypothetical protein F751_6853 [Auxenochlorella protothecoides]|uniref:50S ribosomal protein L19 n=1 Tax=Auxenochlorella protothecoides TaxID=3075 RepID=A0A087SDT1_AUXPR|nr:hypothetical protein F751_6853 [Auxenochlorella protothecoides]KFM23885.1 hypothetical protein F751_6853 [Auxenochlorella protothecoides]
MPWTPTQELLKRKTYTKRMGHMLEVLERERVAQIMKERKIPSFGPGAVLELKLVLEERPVRRAKLYYLRKRVPREYRVA